MSGANVYMLRCADGRFYVGSTRKDLEARIAERNDGTFGGYTFRRRPAALAFAQHFDVISDAIAAERQLKGWSRRKKEALIAGNWEAISMLAARHRPHPSRRRFAPPQDEGRS